MKISLSLSRIDQWRAGSGGGGRGRTLGNAQQITKFLQAKAGKRKITGDIAAIRSSKVIIVDDNDKNIVSEKEKVTQTENNVNESENIHSHVTTIIKKRK